MLAAKPSYCSVLLPAWILACPAVCSAYRTKPRIASGQSREDVTAQDLSRTGCLRGGCWSGRSGRLMSQLPLSPTIAQSTAGSRSTSGYRALLLVLLGLSAGKGHTKDPYPGRYIYICLHPKEVCPWRERDIPGTQLLQPRVWWAETLQPNPHGIFTAWDSPPPAHAVMGSRCVRALKLCAVGRESKVSQGMIHKTKQKTENCSCWRCQGQGEVKPTSDNKLPFSG